eukprot:CAMPEP_0172487124 /NCGR_PEP_ID=MMETSP1066-20121228/16032_1 /TAXON_ID=671091 /ORGANISM="Coscinodiscus wailesii, Strain CCMP2513" /LENGTH=1237 /DNA_ID=CAMNT_0013253525 /DNA_START=99 /DNA_END=3809 /DNA_ORIENTATION=-
MLVVNNNETSTGVPNGRQYYYGSTDDQYRDNNPVSNNTTAAAEGGKDEIIISDEDGHHYHPASNIFLETIKKSVFYQNDTTTTRNDDDDEDDDEDDSSNNSSNNFITNISKIRVLSFLVILSFCTITLSSRLKSANNNNNNGDGGNLNTIITTLSQTTPSSSKSLIKDTPVFFKQFYQPLLENNIIPPPLSTTPPQTLSLPSLTRTSSSSLPSAYFSSLRSGAAKTGKPLPTNAWYQNLLLGDDAPLPTMNNRAYTIPYIVDFVGPVPGVRVHAPNLDMGGDLVVQMSFVERFGLTVGGVGGGVSAGYSLVEDDDVTFSPLGLKVQWGGSQKDRTQGMISPIIRGIPYTTMRYPNDPHRVTPVIISQIPITDPPLIDGRTNLTCDGVTSQTVSSDMELYFIESDFTWLVFVSRPVNVTCSSPSTVSETVVPFQIVVTDELDGGSGGEAFTLRAALGNNCTRGFNPEYCRRGRPADRSEYMSLLRRHADAYPYDTSVKYAYPDGINSDDEHKMVVKFDWGVRRMSDDYTGGGGGVVDEDFVKELLERREEELIMFALPHHVDILHRISDSSNEATGHCSSSLNGPVCIIKGGEWAMIEEVSPSSFTSDNGAVPEADMVEDLASAAREDIKYELPEYYMRGVGDTYFSGKMLAKLARIIGIADELNEISKRSITADVSDEEKETILACQSVELPSEEEIMNAVERLKAGIEVWFNGTAEARYLYDEIWGGLVNCGCWFNEWEKKCDNVFPSCPAFDDPGLDFGNGFYNDHHFHYGYHIYASAVAAHFDPAWGRRNFEYVLLYIRDIANPSPRDKYFPVFRHKDWYLGNSWASGIATVGGRPYLNGRNQESSSESIAAYEGVGLFGKVMEKAFVDDAKNRAVARHISNLGQLMTAMELRSADRYWHVYDHKHRVLPKQYKHNVVGIMWNTMAQFQTWFGAAPFLAYGIQLLPITTVSRRNNILEWCNEFYLDFASSCEKAPDCEAQGWSILQYAILATVGHKQLAYNKTLQLPSDVYDSAGGSGHSMTNSLYYISTLPSVPKPLPLTPQPPKPFDCNCPQTCTPTTLSTDANGFTCRQRIDWLTNHENAADDDACAAVADEFPDQCGGCDTATCNIAPPTPAPRGMTCDCPQTCFRTLANVADGHTCHDRIEWLVSAKGMDVVDACRQVGGMEFMEECGGCDPDRCVVSPAGEEEEEDDGACRPCSREVCRGDMNRCQVVSAPYLCVTGPNRGGCSVTPW